MERSVEGLCLVAMRSQKEGRVVSSPDYPLPYFPFLTATGASISASDARPALLLLLPLHLLLLLLLLQVAPPVAPPPPTALAADVAGYSAATGAAVAVLRRPRRRKTRTMRRQGVNGKKPIRRPFESWLSREAILQNMCHFFWRPSTAYTRKV